ncbi:uncharacterized protein LOC144826381 [Lissotriton helveticus]
MKLEDVGESSGVNHQTRMDLIRSLKEDETSFRDCEDSMEMKVEEGPSSTENPRTLEQFKAEDEVKPPTWHQLCPTVSVKYKEEHGAPCGKVWLLDWMKAEAADERFAGSCWNLMNKTKVEKEEKLSHQKHQDIRNWVNIANKNEKETVAKHPQEARKTPSLFSGGVAKNRKGHIVDPVVCIAWLPQDRCLSGVARVKLLQSTGKENATRSPNLTQAAEPSVQCGNGAINSVLSISHHGCSNLNDGYESESVQGDTVLLRYGPTAQQNSHSLSCTKCKDSTIKKRLQLSHQQEHVLKRAYQCTECERTFYQRANLISHHRVHTGEKPYKCTECGKRFSLKSNFMNHQRTHTGEKPHQCTECEKRFIMKKDLIVHLRTHTGERPYKCTECEKCFSRKDTLCKHEKRHTGEKPFQCTGCKETFSRKDVLKSHQRTHTECETTGSGRDSHMAQSVNGETPTIELVSQKKAPYQCTECKKVFSQKCNLTTHQRTHSGERPYECSECLKKFSYKSYLSVHYRVHTGEKPFRCSECHKSFSQKSSLSKHYETHSG